MCANIIHVRLTKEEHEIQTCVKVPQIKWYVVQRLMNKNMGYELM